ncbi:MAG: hypothetical protein JXR68_00750 [Bacteroidales bacterium]|nr:hypothetical protein [Bacteroidales bacterium]
MKKLLYVISIVIISISTSCDKINNNNNNDPNDSISGILTNNHWFVEFNGTIDGGEGYDVVKSSIDEKIYVCGAFLHVNENWDMKNLARWVPSTNTWEQVPGIDYYHNNFIRCGVTDNNGNIYFGGDFSQIGEIVAGRVAKFNVSDGSWENLRDIDFYDYDQQRGPISGGVYDIEIVGNYIYIGGGTFNSDSSELLYIRQFNISTQKWEAVGSGLNGRVRALATDGQNLYVGGEFTEAGNVQTNYIAKWDGQNWSALGQGSDNYILTLEYYDGKLYAGGSFKFIGNNIHSQGIAYWDGTAWNAMSKGVYASWSNTFSVQDIAIDSDGKVYIGGFFDKKYSDDDTLNHVGVFIEDEWHQLGDGLANSSSQGVMGMLADGKDIYFVGYFGKNGYNINERFNIAIWNETKSY